MENKKKYVLSLSSKDIIQKIFWICIAIELILVILDLTFNYGPLGTSKTLRKIFNIAREQSLGTWFSVVQMSLVGLVSFFISILCRVKGSIYASIGWFVLSFIFLYLSVDDAAKVHERVGTYLEYLYEEDSTGFIGSLVNSFPSYAWQLFLFPMFFSMGVFILVFLWKQLSTKALKMLLIAGFCCWGGAFIIDYIEGKEVLFEQLADYWNVKKYTVSHPFLMLEEFLEMFGTTLFFVLVLHLFFESLVEESQRLDKTKS